MIKTKSWRTSKDIMRNHLGSESNLEPNCSLHTCQDMDKDIGKGKEREF
jgi:hypothetical protein